MSIVTTGGAWSSGATSVIMALPASPAAGDWHTIFVGAKPYNAVINTPAGWELVPGSNGSNGTVANGTDVGSVCWASFRRKWQSGDGNVTVSITSGNTALGCATRYRPTAGYSILPPVACKGYDNTSGTGYSATMDANPGITTGDALVHYTFAPGNNTTFGTPTMSATGATIGTVTENYATEGSSSTGLDCEASASTALCTAGNASAAPVGGWTLSVAQTGGGSFIRVREVLPAFDQDSFRLRNDDGDEATATWKVAANQNTSLNVDENFRCRFVVQETAGGSVTNEGFKFQYRLNAGSWTDITTTSSVVKSVLSPNFTDGVDCVQRIGAGTFITDNDGMDENGATGAVADFAGNDETEVEGCFQIVGADVANNDVIEIKVVRDDGTVLDSYTSTPSITAIKVVAYSLVCDSGSFAETGTAANLEAGRKVVADSGSFAATGTAATLSRGRTLACDGGSFAETGVAASLKKGCKVIADSGAISLIGTDAHLHPPSAHMEGWSGSFALSGMNAALKAGRMADADSGSFAATGMDALFTVGHRLFAIAGGFTETGISASLRASYKIIADEGFFDSEGMDITLTYTPLGAYILACDAGFFSEEGSVATLTYQAHAVLSAEAGAFALVGQAAALTWSGGADPDSITVSFSQMRQPSALFEDIKQPALSVAVKQPTAIFTLPGETI
jgi:hypothetical protein